MVTALLGVVGAIGSAVIGSKAGSDAAEAQAAAANLAAQTQLETARLSADTTLSMFNRSRADLEPWRQVGGSALFELADLYGLSRPADLSGAVLGPDAPVSTREAAARTISPLQAAASPPTTSAAPAVSSLQSAGSPRATGDPNLDIALTRFLSGGQSPLAQDAVWQWAAGLSPADKRLAPGLIMEGNPMLAQMGYPLGGLQPQYAGGARNGTDMRFFGIPDAGGLETNAGGVSTGLPQGSSTTLTPAALENALFSMAQSAQGPAPAPTLQMLGAGTRDARQDDAEANFQDSLLYQAMIENTGFVQEQGVRAIERGAAARGGLYSGGAMKALQRYGQGLAGQNFNTVWNTYTGALAELAGIGGDTAIAAATASGNAAQGIADSLNTGASGAGLFLQNAGIAQGNAGIDRANQGTNFIRNTLFALGQPKAKAVINNFFGFGGGANLSASFAPRPVAPLQGGFSL